MHSLSMTGNEKSQTNQNYYKYYAPDGAYIFADPYNSIHISSLKGLETAVET